jgi:hypothetical protein
MPISSSNFSWITCRFVHAVLPACWLVARTHFSSGHLVSDGDSIAHHDTHTAHWRLINSFAAAMLIVVIDWRASALRSVEGFCRLPIAAVDLTRRFVVLSMMTEQSLDHQYLKVTGGKTHHLVYDSARRLLPRDGVVTQKMTET